MFCLCFFYLFYIDFCRTDYLNVYLTDLHRTCEAAIARIWVLLVRLIRWQRDDSYASILLSVETFRTPRAGGAVRWAKLISDWLLQ